MRYKHAYVGTHTEAHGGTTFRSSQRSGFSAGRDETMMKTAVAMEKKRSASFLIGFGIRRCPDGHGRPCETAHFLVALLSGQTCTPV
jgi:hypothetical protein